MIFPFFRLDHGPLRPVTRKKRRKNADQAVRVISFDPQTLVNKAPVETTLVLPTGAGSSVYMSCLPQLEGNQSKRSTGCSPSPSMSSSPISRQEWNTLRGNWNKEVKEDTSIGSRSLCSHEREPCELCRIFSENEVIMKRAGRTGQMNTSGKKTPVLQEPNSSWVSSRSGSTTSWTGQEFGNLQKLVRTNKSPREFEYRIIGLSERFARTIQRQLEWSELVKFSGVKLELESRFELGTKQEWTLILKIPEQSFGADTKVRNMLSWMSFEELWTSPIYYDGWIGTHSTWKSKELIQLQDSIQCGSRQT